MNIFRRCSQLKLFKVGLQSRNFLSTDTTKCEAGIISGLNSLSITPPVKQSYNPALTFSPHSIINGNYHIDIIRPSILDIPRMPIIPRIPNINNNAILDLPFNEQPMECPTIQDVQEKHAIRMIVIRRRKMRIHKLKKLRKRMKYEWAKLRQRRRIRKEKAFQASLVAKVKEATDFSPEEYITNKLKLANETPIPRLWKGRRLPQFIIKQLMGLEKRVKYKKY